MEAARRRPAAAGARLPAGGAVLGVLAQAVQQHLAPHLHGARVARRGAAAAARVQPAPEAHHQPVRRRRHEVAPPARAGVRGALLRDQALLPAEGSARVFHNRGQSCRESAAAPCRCAPPGHRREQHTARPGRAAASIPRLCCRPAGAPRLPACNTAEAPTKRTGAAYSGPAWQGKGGVRRRACARSRCPRQRRTSARGGPAARVLHFQMGRDSECQTRTPSVATADRHAQRTAARCI